MIPISDPSFAEEIKVFRDRCIVLRSYGRHFETLFLFSSQADESRMRGTASIFFGDLHRMFLETLVLQVCRMTDPAKTGRFENHTIEFIRQHYDFSTYPVAAKRLEDLSAGIHAFRDKILPARNKLISHSDRETILSGMELSGGSNEEWAAFWRDLRDLVLVLTELAGCILDIDNVGLQTDADGLLRALVDSACFDHLIDDPGLSMRCFDLVENERSKP